jgi:hypothetical protein
VAAEERRHGTTVTLDIQVVRSLPGSLLPVAGRPLSLHAANVDADVTSGNLAAWRAGSLAGYRYQVTGVVPLADKDLTRLVPDPSDEQAPALPEEAFAFSAPLAVTTVPAYQRLTTLAKKLRALPYDETSPAGESLAAVDEALARRRGSFAEQRASAFAMMAGARGFSTRVAVGYRIPATGISHGKITVTSAQGDAWPEVHFPGYGWVPFDVTGTRRPAPTTRPRKACAARTDARQGGEDDSQVVDPGRLDGGGKPLLVTPVTNRSRRLAALAGALAVLATAGGIIGAKQRRRSRRRKGHSAADQVVGAWAEALDRLVEVGVAPRDSLAPDEVAESVAMTLGEDTARPLRTLSPLVEEAVFAPWPPSDAVVRQAWRCERDLRTTLAVRSPRALRWQRHLDPRPLLPRRSHRTRSRRPRVDRIRTGRGRGSTR